MWRSLVLFGLMIPLSVRAAPVEVCFVPTERCDLRIADAIAGAHHDIRVQAYGFNSTVILPALVAAHARGVDIAVVLDRTDERGVRVGIGTMRAAGIPVWIDTPPGIAHMKAIVIDGRTVVAGSFNFTNAAQRRNVEDVLFIADATLAEKFLGEWADRRAVSRPPLDDEMADR